MTYVGTIDKGQLIESELHDVNNLNTHTVSVTNNPPWKWKKKNPTSYHSQEVNIIS